MPRVLVIDDQPDVRETISVALNANGIEVVAVENGRLGLIELNKALSNTALFDLAIVDIYMPDMDGVKLIKAIRELTPKLPIIAISGVFLRPSGRTVLDILPTAHDLSGITCLQKPFRTKELLQVIQKTIGVSA
jgi:CheY-like chemotaxis protein